MPDQLDLELPTGLGPLLQQISSIIAAGASPFLGDIVPKILPTMMASAATTLLAASGAVLPRCNLAPPPEDIFISIDAQTKGLRLECKHSPPHCWGFDGQRGNC